MIKKTLTVVALVGLVSTPTAVFYGSGLAESFQTVLQKVVSGFTNEVDGSAVEKAYAKSVDLGHEVSPEVQKRLVGIHSRGSRGTGVLLSPGVVLTVEHVIDSNTTHTVMRAGHKPKRYYVIAYSDNKDIALLVDSPNRVIPLTVLEQFEMAKNGVKATAYGYGGGTVLSAVKGEVNMYNLVADHYTAFTNHFIGGMSGGPLLTESGKIVGLVSAGYSFPHYITEKEKETYLKAYNNYTLNGIQVDQKYLKGGFIIKYPSINARPSEIVDMIRQVQTQFSILGKHLVIDLDRS